MDAAYAGGAAGAAGGGDGPRALQSADRSMLESRPRALLDDGTHVEIARCAGERECPFFIDKLLVRILY